MRKYRIVILDPLDISDIPDFGMKPEVYTLKPTLDKVCELHGNGSIHTINFAPNNRTIKDEIFSHWSEIEKKRWLKEHQTETTKTQSISKDKEDELHQKFENFKAELNRVRVIFLFPESLTEEQYNKVKPLFEDLVDGTARELKNSISANYHCFAFCNSNQKKQKKEKKERRISLREKLSSRLLARLPSQVYDLENELEREGPLLFSGPSGTGKSLAAQLAADKLGKKLVSVNVTGVTEDLIEARLRGFTKGAFTGAIEETNGWFGQADDNILFLDEFQNAPEHIQTQLLDLVSANSDRVTLSRIGQEGETNSYHVKLILALNEEIQELIEKKRFRKDLFYRIRRIIDFPSLNDILKSKKQDSREDQDCRTYIQILFKIYQWRHGLLFMRNNNQYPLETLFLELSDEAIQRLGENSWPGNFREFEMCAAEIVNLAQKLSQQKVDGSLVESAICKLPSQRLNKNAPQKMQPKSAVKIVEQALVRENFVFTNSTKHLKDIKVGSTTSLRNFLKKHYSELSPEIQANPKIRRFMGHL